MLVPEVLTVALSRTDASILQQQARVRDARNELGNQEEYLRALLAEKELVTRSIALLEKAP